MTDPVLIGGAPAVTLTAPEVPPDRPAFVSATVLPGRGMMLLQARLRLPDGREVDALSAPPLDEAARRLNGDASGNESFAFGGAILAPFANRIRGDRADDDTRLIETVVAGHRLRLTANWGGAAAGGEIFAMHGLILDAAAPFETPAPDLVRGRLEASDFGGRWVGRIDLDFEWRLADGALRLSVTARNVGDEPAPIGIGWHPYFAVADRRQARLRLPAALRAEVGDYDEVLPTGRLLPVAGTPYDFNGDAALGDLFLDDAFTDLRREAGQVVVELRDPAAGFGLRIASPSPQVKAVQVYAPPDGSFVAIEPQYNLADPYGAVWPAGTDTGMARLEPGDSVTYEVSVTAFTLGTQPRPSG